MEPAKVLASIVYPAYRLGLLPSQLNSPESRVVTLAAGLQESRLEKRDQDDPGHKLGPALGLWQFELGTANRKGGGVYGLIRHKASRYWVAHACQLRGIPLNNAYALWQALATDDLLAFTLARLLVFTDPYRLPALGDEQAAWDLYALRCWRPGKPDRQRWRESYPAALAAVQADLRTREAQA